jgi:hypothetical protein
MKNYVLKMVVASAVLFAQLQVGAQQIPSVNDLGETSSEALSVQNRIEVISENASIAGEKRRLFEGGDWVKKLMDWKNLDKADKVILINIVSIGFMTLWGLMSWDYGSAKMQMKNEGWFGNNTKFGGADKMGHMWSTFAMADLYGHLFRQWGYTPEKAARLSSISSWLFMGVMEVMDSSSAQHGFSYEDFTMNTLGAVMSYFLQRYPELDDKFDFRLEYNPKKFKADFFTDYESMKYVFVLKASGFHQLKNSFLKYLEFHVGYYTRGFDITPKAEDRTRNLYVGLGLNVPLALKQAGLEKTGSVMEYFQLPFAAMELGSRNANK